uniref:Uncharacterized protein n=1 Tax=Arundo donax TaxID=35708 RepID=A0A0A9BQY8_ARUDO
MTPRPPVTSALRPGAAATPAAARRKP